MTRIILIMVLWCAPVAAMSADGQPSKQEQMATLQTQVDDAVKRVAQIVNQPVKHYPRSSWALVQIYPTWFHGGATAPNFATVDIRKTRETPYDQFHYVTSNQNPGEMFVGSDLEFNAMTKYFYTDRTVPKKKLTDAEMVEINGLYRIIAASQQRLYALKNESPFTLSAAREFVDSLYGTALLLVLVGGTFILLYRRWYKR